MSSELHRRETFTSGLFDLYILRTEESCCHVSHKQEKFKERTTAFHYIFAVIGHNPFSNNLHLLKLPFELIDEDFNSL